MNDKAALRTKHFFSEITHFSGAEKGTSNVLLFSKDYKLVEGRPN